MSLAQVFSCEFCEISKNTFFKRTPPMAASIIWQNFGYGLRVKRKEKFGNVIALHIILRNEILGNGGLFKVAST